MACTLRSACAQQPRAERDPRHLAYRIRRRISAGGEKLPDERRLTDSSSRHGRVRLTWGRPESSRNWRETTGQHAHAALAELLGETVHGRVLRVDELAAELALPSVGKAVAHRPEAPARACTRLDERDAGTGLLELARCGQPRQPGTCHDDSCCAHDDDAPTSSVPRPRRIIARMCQRRLG